MNGKLICLDIDGTLLNDKKELLPQVRDAVREASRRGARIVLMSGRMPSGVELLEEALGVPCIKVCNAGTYIILGDRCISVRFIEPRTMVDIYREIAVKHGVPLWIFREKEWFVTDVDPYIGREIRFVRYRPTVVNAEELAGRFALAGTGPNKLLVAAVPEKIQEIYREMKAWALPDIDIACSADIFLEIFPRGVTKGTALEKLCETLGIARENTVAIGDQELDLPMIEVAGIGIAMGNAIGELKQKADFVTLTNNEAGVACALRQLFEAQEA